MKDTRMKFNEAVYFLDEMKRFSDDYTLCSFNASAFLSAARSVTLVMQVEYSHDEKFKKWYAKKQEEMTKDADFKYFNDQRVKTIHKEPVKPLLAISMGPITLSGNSVVDIPIGTVGENGIILSQDWITVDGVPHPEIDRPPMSQYFVFEDKEDESAIDICSRYLEKLRGMLNEWEQILHTTNESGSSNDKSA